MGFSPFLFLYIAAVQASQEYYNPCTTGGIDINPRHVSMGMQLQYRTSPSLFISPFMKPLHTPNKPSFTNNKKHDSSYPTEAMPSSSNLRQVSFHTHIHMFPDNKQQNPDTQASNSNVEETTQEQQDLQKDLRKFRIRSTILENEVQKKDEERNKLERRLLILQDVVPKLNATNEKLLQELTLLREEYTELSSRTEQQQQQQQEKEKSTFELSAEREVEYQHGLERTEQQLQQLQERYETTKVKYQQLHEEYNDMMDLREQENTSRNEEIERMQKKYQRQAQQVSNLRQELEERQEASEKEEEENEDTTLDQLPSQDITLLQEECSSLTRQVSTLQQEQSQAKQHLQDLMSTWRSRRSKLESIIKQQQKQHAYSLESTQERFEKREERLMKQLTDISCEMEDWKGQYDMLNSTVNHQSQTVKGSQGDSVLVDEGKDVAVNNKLVKDLKQKIKSFEESMEIATVSVEQSEQREKDLQKQLQTIQNDYQLLQQERDQLQTAVNVYIQRGQERYQKEQEWIDTEKQLKIFNSLKEAKVKSLEETENELRELLLRERAKFGLDRDVMERGWENKMSQLRQEYEDKLEKAMGRAQQIQVNGDNTDVEHNKAKPRRVTRIWRRIKSSANIFRQKK